MIPSLIDFRGSSVSEQNEHNGRLLCTKRSSCANINIYEDDKIKQKFCAMFGNLAGHVYD